MTTTETFNQIWRSKIDAYLAKRLSDVEITQPKLAASMRYSVLAGGKRMRPLLYLATIQSWTTLDEEMDLAIAGALELVHTYSLIHDDLPAMDNDDYRRGQLTNHKRFGEAMAILAGDGLLTLAFQWLGAAAPAAVGGKMCATLAQASGPSGMVAGQAIDITATGTDVSDLTTIKQLDALKTGALLTVPLALAAERLALPVPATEALLDFGRHFGLAFQIFDDLQDLHGDAAQLGKAVHKDTKAGKNTYPSLLGVPAAQAVLAQEVQQARMILTRLTAAADFSSDLLIGFLDYFDKEMKL
ncbi:polyprenyl synthetase family protein [Lapidilactobacillus luobeiensis]|uniref:polyprenyl synthetase family protein n=1 Tax=Lapidilactobacillus luobeiensis TaxID=2950371 RepID=UPI0021C46C3E|nr:farnesyl diphosphate synthase [Lapidilactobacillus luobeiensis]